MDVITETRNQTYAYWFSDGLAEIVSGVLCVIVGALFYLSVILGTDLLANGALAAMVLGVLAGGKAIGWAKDRITYPRTGYVKYPDPSRTRRGTAAVIALVVAAVVSVASTLARDAGMSVTANLATVAGFGAGIAVVSAVRAYKMAIGRLYALALVILAATAWALSRGFEMNAAIGVILLAFGVAAVITGASALAEYLRRNPLAGGADS